MNKTNVFLIHFYSVNDYFIQTLQSLGYTIKGISIPHFARLENDANDIRKLLPDALFTDLANFLQPDNVPLVNILIPPRLDEKRILHLVMQAGRMEGLSHLSQITLVETIEKLITFYLYLLQKYSINLVVCGGFPHSFVDSCFIYAAELSSIKTFILQDRPIAHRRCLAYNSNYEKIQIGRWESDISPNSLANEILDYHRRTHSFYIDKTLTESKSLWKSVYSYNHKEGIRSRLKNISRDNNLDVTPGLEYLDRWEHRSINSQSIGSIGTFCVFYLHVEPESAVNPCLGFDYKTQIHMIKRLRMALESSIPLIIKEHPAMFLAQFQNPDKLKTYRSEYFLRQIEDLPNTFKVSAQDTIDFNTANIGLLATISGTAIYDFTFKRIPCLCHKSAPAFGSIGTYDIDEQLSISLATLDDWHRDLKATKTLDLVLSWIHNSLPGSPNAHFSQFNQIRSDQEIMKNSRELAHSISYVHKSL